MDAAEYKHVVLGLIFLKYISDRFEDLHSRREADEYNDPEDKDKYLTENVFYLPPSDRWKYLQHQRAKLPRIGKDLDDAMEAIEKDNPSLKGVLDICLRHTRKSWPFFTLFFGWYRMAEKCPISNL